MAKRIVATLVVLGVLLAGYWAYSRYSNGGRLRDGEVVVSDSDGTPVQAVPNQSESAGSGNALPAAQAPSGNAQSTSLAQFQAAQTRSNGAPVTDTQAPNAPNGAAFAGSGRYQIYRQGNLTWRINTENGSSCILFATNEEWRKPEVYNHGCPNS